MKKIIVITFALLSLTLIYYQGQNPIWNAHLQVDVWVWFERLTNFFRQQSFAFLKDNELLPATLFYIFIPAIFSGWSLVAFHLYLSATMGVNLFILLIHYLSCRGREWLTKLFLFSLLVVSFGPTNLFRFDGLATLLVILGFLSWQKRWFSLSGIAFGLATGIKLYPVVFMPYLFLLLFTRRQLRPLKTLIVFYLISLLLPISAFLFLGGRLDQIATTLDFHKYKYVSIESLPASLLTAASLIKFHLPLPLLAGYGVWGIDLNFITKLKLPFFNLLWILPVGIFYLYLIFNKKLLQRLNLVIVYCLILLFLTFSKNLNPQYVWWFVSLFPFLSAKLIGRFTYWLNFISLIFINLFNQLVYPLYYTQLIENFYQYNRQYAVFYALLLRNLLIVILLIVSLRSVLIKRIVRI